MKKLQEVTKCWNDFACAAISAEYNTWETVNLKPITEQLIQAIEQYVKEIEEEKELEDEKRNKQTY